MVSGRSGIPGHRGLPTDLVGPANPEEIRGAKEWLTDKMPPGRSYAETTDQPAFSDLFDMNAARRADSFDKCYREIKKMLEKLREASSE